MAKQGQVKANRNNPKTSTGRPTEEGKKRVAKKALRHARLARDAVTALNLDQLVGVEFVTTYVGRGVDPGSKSLTLRCRFRATDRTLTHEEVTPQMDRVMTALADAVGGQVRG